MNFKWLITGALFSSIGMSFVWPLTSVYLHNRLGVSLTWIGVVLLFNSLASVLGSYLGGYLYDRKNPYHLLVGGVVASTITLLVLIFFHGWPVFGIVLFFNGISGGWNLAIVNSIGTSIKTKDSRYVFNMLYFVQNLGIVIGTSLVGFIYSISVTLMFVVASLLFIIFLGIVITKYKPAANESRKRVSDTEKTTWDAKHLPRANTIILITFFMSLFIIWIMYQQWVSNLSVYMTGLGIPLRNYSFLWTVNAGLIVISQIIINWIARYHENLIMQIFFGFSMFAVSFITLIFAKTYPTFVLAMVILTIGEATALPTIPALVNVLTPVEAKGRYQGLIQSYASAGRAIGPLFGGMIIETTSYTALFVIATVAVLVVLAATVVLWNALHGKLTEYQ
ncbi:MDR family MFS transporter [Lentilactobacillus kisonensis]|uniref:Transporter, major facilitator family protein n=1 Tax=Lentilactobacillus kisonensis DSM 19906 = JCM 15041 TaxID=1423766 RepID=A0A0R1NY65_9LACO|nr:MFS transporter [Lentilactobacillus kisonensis]KRL22690.1 transporter, major facilitator family protein [Lentilactobacillus kisonensis DSM 19906 = JCM 15041]